MGVDGIEDLGASAPPDDENSEQTETVDNGEESEESSESDDSVNDEVQNVSESETQ